MIRRTTQGTFLLLCALLVAGCGGESTSQGPSGVDFQKGRDLAKSIPSPTAGKRQGHMPRTAVRR